MNTLSSYRQPGSEEHRLQNRFFQGRQPWKMLILDLCCWKTDKNPNFKAVFPSSPSAGKVCKQAQ